MEASEQNVSESTAKVAQLQAEITAFTAAFQATHEGNVAGINKLIQTFGDMLHEERAAIADLCTELKAENRALARELTAKMEQLSEELALEKKLWTHWMSVPKW